MVEQFPSQSHKTHEPREVTPVTLRPGRVRKAPWGRRVRESMLQGDPKSAWSSMIWNSFFPGLAEQLESAMHEGLSTLFGGTSSVYRRQRQQPGSRITRHNPDQALGGRQNERFTPDDRRRQDTSVMEVDSRAEAEQILASMQQTIDQYDMVTLAEFYELMQVSPNHTDYKFGWEELGGAKIVHSRGAYFLDLPPVITLK